MPEQRILIVDDEADTALVCQRILTYQGYQTEMVQTGDEALERVKEQSFDLLLTDIRMPGMNGLELVEAVRQMAPHMVCVTMTGSPTMDFALKALRLGVDGFVVKPFSPDELGMAIHNALGKASLRGQVEQLHRQVADLQRQLQEERAKHS